MVVKQVGPRNWDKRMPTEATIMKKLNEANWSAIAVTGDTLDTEYTEST